MHKQDAYAGCTSRMHEQDAKPRPITAAKNSMCTYGIGIWDWDLGSDHTLSGMEEVSSIAGIHHPQKHSILGARAAGSRG